MMMMMMMINVSISIWMHGLAGLLGSGRVLSAICMPVCACNAYLLAVIDCLSLGRREGSLNGDRSSGARWHVKQG
jgi:hypothetical protein